MIPMINNSDLKYIIIIIFNLIQFKYKIMLEKTNLLNVISLVANFALKSSQLTISRTFN